MSMCSSLSFGALERSSDSIKWIAFLPTTPRTGPFSVCTTTRWPTRIVGSQPPTAPNQRKPFSSMCVTTTPISSMWPTNAIRGAPWAVPGTRACTEPVRSTSTWSVYSRAIAANAVAGPCSWPEGPTASRRLCRLAGTLMPPIVSGDQVAASGAPRPGSGASGPSIGSTIAAVTALIASATVSGRVIGTMWPPSQLWKETTFGR